MRKKRLLAGISTPTVIVVVVLMLLIGGGVWWYLSSENVTSPSSQTTNTTPTTKTDDTKLNPLLEGMTWATYHNTEYGYSFAHPANWQKYEAVAGQTGYAEEVLSEYESQKITYLETGDFFHQGNFQVVVLKNPEQLSLTEFLNTYKTDNKIIRLSSLGDITSDSSITLGSINARKFVYTGTGNHQEARIFFEKNGLLYMLSYDEFTQLDDKVEYHSAIYDYILDSFQGD